MSVATFSNIPSRGGTITKSGTSTYVAYPGATFSQVGRNPAPPGFNPVTEEQAYFSFDTSSLPSTATVTQVRLQLVHDSNQTGAGDDPVSWINYIYAGDIIGTGLTTDDWTGGSLAHFILWSGVPAGGWQTFTWPGTVVQLGGYTDVMIKDLSNYTAPTELWRTNWKNATTCKLEVTYSDSAYRAIIIS